MKKSYTKNKLKAKKTVKSLKEETNLGNIKLQKKMREKKEATKKRLARKKLEAIRLANLRAKKLREEQEKNEVYLEEERMIKVAEMNRKAKLKEIAKKRGFKLLKEEAEEADRLRKINKKS